jgi:hypothetical protein
MTNIQVAEHLHALAQSLMTDAEALEGSARLAQENLAALDFYCRVRSRMTNIERLGKAIGKREAVEAILALAKEVLE